MVQWRLIWKNLDLVKISLPTNLFAIAFDLVKNLNLVNFFYSENRKSIAKSKFSCMPLVQWNLDFTCSLASSKKKKYCQFETEMRTYKAKIV